MGLFSFLRKNKQESSSAQGEFLSRSAGASSAAARSRSAANAANDRGKSAKAGKDDALDPALPEKKRARRRLIGAVALVLAVVIVLPMILDSEPRPLADDIAIQIPSKDGKADNADAKPATPVAQPKEEFVDPATLAPDAAAIPSGPASSSLTKPAAQAEPVAADLEKPVHKPEAPKAIAKPDIKVEPKAEAKADVKDSKSAEHKKDDKEVDKPDDTARAMAILEGKPVDRKAAPAAAAGSKFVIQVAALATQEKIDELRNKLNGAGIKSFTQKVATQSGDRTRIRVGPFANRDEAEKMRVKINKLGLNATILPA